MIIECNSIGNIEKWIERRLKELYERKFQITPLTQESSFVIGQICSLEDILGEIEAAKKDKPDDWECG